MALLALRAGHHGVVVGADDDAAGILGKLVAVDLRKAHDEAVGRRFIDQLLDRGGGAPGGNGEPAIFEERAGIAKVLDILPRRALAALAPARDRGGTSGVERPRPPRLHFGKIVADVIEIDLLGGGGDAAGILGLFDEQQRMALEHGIADRHRDRTHDAADGGGDLVLHLHRLHHQHALTAAHLVAFGDLEADDRSLHGRSDGLCPLRTIDCVRERRLGGFRFQPTLAVAASVPLPSATTASGSVVLSRMPAVRGAPAAAGGSK